MDEKVACRHDYINAIRIGEVDYQCPLCGKILDPLEWFLMSNFEFIDVGLEESKDNYLKNNVKMRIDGK